MRILIDSASKAEYTLNIGKSVVGSAPASHVLIDKATVSQVHVIIEVDNEQNMIIKNMTYNNNTWFHG